jgi:hypothetical protein
VNEPAFDTISLWQPWASLVFADPPCKRHETRSFAYPASRHRREVAIHAAKTFPARRFISPELHDLCVETYGSNYAETLPLGAILGTVRLNGCLNTQFVEPCCADRICGDWTPGRYAWELQDPHALGVPVPWKGRQGWFVVPAQALGRAAPVEELFA